MAVHANDGFAGLEFPHVVMQMPNELAKFIGHSPAHCIGDIHCGGTGRHDGLANFYEKVRLRPRTIFR